MVKFKQFIMPIIFVIVISLVFKLDNMSDGLGKLCTYFTITIFPVLITQLNNVKKQRDDIRPIVFVGLLISYTLITLTIAIIILLVFNKN